MGNEGRNPETADKRGKIERVEEMPVYGVLYDLAVDVERASRSFTADFRWLRIQVLRSSESSFTNLSEGFTAQYSTEYLQSLYRAKREARERVSHSKYSADVEQMPADVSGDLVARYEDGFRPLGHVIKSIERKIRERGKSKPGFSKIREDTAPYGSEPHDNKPESCS
jgi:four helix bundle protein